ncbi:uncharacterized protein ISCGN_005251 [Ixodes scapularis]
MCTADAHTDDSGCADSTQTTRAPGMVNALGRSTSTCDDPSPPSLRPAESSGRRRHDVQLRRCTDPDVKACRPSLLAGETRRGNPWRWSCRRRPTPRSSTNVGGPPLERYQRSKRRPATVSNNLNVVIDGHDASALVDTGADYSVLSGRLSRRLRKVMTPWDGPQIRTAGGHLITPVGRCTARVEIHGETCPVKFVVLQDCSRDVILGMDFLCEYGAVIDLGTNRLTLRKPAPPAEEPKATSPTVRVLANHVNLPPRSSVFVPVGIDEASCGEVLLEGSLQLLLGRGIGVARGVAELQDGRTVALVTNFRNETQHLTKGAAVGHVEKLRNSAEIAAITDESSPPQQDRATSRHITMLLEVSVSSTLQLRLKI